MSRPEAAPEPNMEDILASIRKIIAEEPGAVKAPPEARASPAIGTRENSASAQAGSREGGAARAEPAAPLDGLDDLLDDVPPSPLRSTTAAMPQASAGAGNASNSTDVRAPSEPATLTTREAPVSARSFEELLRERPSAKSTATPAQPAAARPSPFDLSPLAIAGRDATPATASPKPASDLGDIVPSRNFDDTAGAAPAEAPATGATSGGATSGDPFRWPGPKLTGAPDFLRKSSAAAPASAPTLDRTVEDKSLSSGAPAKPASSPAEPETTSGYEVIASMAPRTEARTGAAAEKTVSAASVSDVAPKPTAQTAPDQTDVQPDPVKASDGSLDAVAIESTAAAASALGALAAGLAASSKSFMPPAGPTPSSASEEMTTASAAPVAAEPSAMPVEASAALPSSDQAAPASPMIATRTLEDTVAEMLRPMLRQWLDDNMPRIVEKALLVEVADGVLKGQQPAKPREG